MDVWVLVIGSDGGGENWITVHETMESGKECVFVYVTENWQTLLEDEDMPLGWDERVTQYFDTIGDDEWWSLENYEVKNLNVIPQKVF